MIRRPPRSTPLYSSAASDVYKRQLQFLAAGSVVGCSCHVVFASSVQRISIYPIGYPVEDVTAWVGRRQVGWEYPVLNVAAAVLYQVLDHGRISQGGDISQLIHFISRDLAENAPHDLAAPGLGQCRSPLDEVRSRNGSDLLADMLDQLIPQRFSGLHPGIQGDVSVNALTLDLMREADYGRFGHGVVTDQSGLHLCGAHTVPGDVDHIIHTACDPVVAVLVPHAAIAGKVPVSYTHL